MNAFHTVAAPHDDITTKRLTMDVFAADLWNTFRNRGPEEYTDTDTFFQKTHMTSNLQNLLTAIQNRLEGRGGDSFQHIETPFGGGKTHALIAMYHSAKRWGAKTVVIVGTAMSVDDTPWGLIEKQLDGKIDKMAGKLAPGREKLRAVLERHGPVLILIDELLPYASVAAGVKIGKTTLASQTVIFIQQLSEEVAALGRVCVIASLPASVVEVADREIAEELLRKIRKVSSRKEKKITPIDPDDVPDIIRSRLFSTPENEIRKNAHETISRFVGYCEKESILPPDKTAKQYGEEFAHTYPFLPQVIDMLYHNWGTFDSFQRTRGVLRLLSLVVYSLRNSEKPYITLADFDLQNDEIRRELLEHVGDRLDSVISKDITDSDSGSRKAERDMGPTMRGLQLGTKAATSIFMSSFSSGGTSGATINQIKRDVSNIDTHSAVIDGVVMSFENKLSYIKKEDDRYLFSTVPNINRLKLDKMESITDDEIRENEKMLLTANMGSQKLHPRIWPGHRDVDDSPALKLVVLKDGDERSCNEIAENKGSVPRIYRNSLLFLCPSDAERTQFVDSLKSRIALKKITGDKSLKPEQQKNIAEELKKEESNLRYSIKRYYRTLRILGRSGLTTIDLGVPTIAAMKGMAEDAYDMLIREQQIHEKIGPMTLENEYLKDREFERTSTLYESMLKTRGSRRPISRDVIRDGLVEGAKNGVFGIGRLEGDTPTCIHFKTDSASVEFSDDEVIIRRHLCEAEPPHTESITPRTPEPGEAPKAEQQKGGEPIRNHLDFEFMVPEGKMNEVIGTLKLVNEKFNSIKFHIVARDGFMTDNDIEKIRETLRQINTSSNL